MISFGLTLRRFFQAMIFSWSDPYFRSTLALLLGIFMSGTIFFHTVEGWTWIDSLYFSVMTAATIGYGDLVPTMPISKLFTVIYAIVSIGVFVALVTQVARSLTKPK